jgi:hypothetical protein
LSLVAEFGQKLLRRHEIRGYRRWCSDGFEIGCDNGERVRVVL